MLEVRRGVYEARRAAALAGVPVSTLHYWARTLLYVPSICPEPRVRLWSWADLLALRAIDFFRRDKGATTEPRRATIRSIRDALVELDREDIPRERLYEVLAVSHGGKLFLTFNERAVLADPSRQGVLPDVLHLVRPYGSGPDLLKPRPELRIIPGKLHGEPHLVNTRIPSAALYALDRAGYRLDQIREMYPEASRAALDEAIDLERSLAGQAAA